ncbi:MAG TPA: acyltransferase family protein, partial [Acidimicrobiia bacterium]|nr:acyltransferase family protein [Acidimicrobiia bacterium]
GVDAFFVLSGFLITTLLITEWRDTGTINLKSFWSHRARRLLPALVLVIACVAAYAAWFANPLELHQLRSDALSTLGYVANWNQIFSHQSYFQQFAAPSPLKHTWSLAIEEQFYLVWPLAIFGAMRLFRGSRRALIGVCAALAAGSAVLMAVLYHPDSDPSRVYYGTDTRAQSLLVGAVLALVLANRKERTSSPVRLHAAAGLATVALGYIWVTTGELDSWQYRGGFLLSAVLVSIVIASITHPRDTGPVGFVLSAPPLRAIGVISYGVYLWHWPIYVFLSPARTGLDGFQVLAARLIATFAVATASFYVVEWPIRRGFVAGWRVRAALPAAATCLAIAVVASTAGAVPAEFASISTALPPSVPPAAAPMVAKLTARPMRVMIVGDSVAASLAPGLQMEANGRGIVFWSAATPGCGLSSDIGDRWNDYWAAPNPNCLPSWRTQWRRQVAAFRPDVVIGLFGAQDAFDRRIDGNVIRFDTPAGAQLAEQNLNDAISTLSSRGARVVVLTTPYYRLGWPMRIDMQRSAFNQPWIDRYNSLIRDVVTQRHDGTRVIDLNRYVDPGGTWTKTIGSVTVRRFDLMHFSPAGADYVAKWLVPQLAGRPAGSRPR